MQGPDEGIIPFVEAVDIGHRNAVPQAAAQAGRYGGAGFEEQGQPGQQEIAVLVVVVEAQAGLQAQAGQRVPIVLGKSAQRGVAVGAAQRRSATVEGGQLLAVGVQAQHQRVARAGAAQVAGLGIIRGLVGREARRIGIHDANKIRQRGLERETAAGQTIVSIKQVGGIAQAAVVDVK